MTIPLPAQDMAFGGVTRESELTGKTVSQVSRPSLSPLDTKVTVEFHDVPLSTALEQLMKTSGVQIMYSHTIVPATKQVSLKGTDMTLGTALATVLRGTQTIASALSGSKVVISRVTDVLSDGTIVGKVVHAKTKQPIVATVATGNVKVVSAADGTFRLVLPPGRAVITIRAVGFNRESRDVVVSSGQTVSVEVMLEPSASVLDEVIVTGTVVATERKAISNPITVFTAADIEKRGITRIEQLFRGEVPGVLARDKGSDVYAGGNGGFLNPDDLNRSIRSDIYVRGSSGLSATPAPMKTFIDGVELIDPAYLGILDPQSIERIEIVVGPQAATVYGSGAMGGVMQIFTKKGGSAEAPRLGLRLQYGTLQGNVTDALAPVHQHTLSITGAVRSAFSYAANIGYTYDGQWQPGVFSRSTGVSIGGTLTQGPVVVTGSVSTTLGQNGTFQGDGIGNGAALFQSMIETGEWAPGTPGGRRTNINLWRTLGSSSQATAFNVDYRSRFGHHHLTAGTSQVNSRIETRQRAFESPEDSLFPDGSSAGTRTTLGYNLSQMWRGGRMSATITSGVTGTWSNGSSILGCLAYPSATMVGPCGFASLRVGKPFSDRSWGGFGTIQIGIFDQLFLNGGLRGEHNPAYGEDHAVDWTPTVGAAYTLELNDAVTLKLLGSYGRATKPPLEYHRREQMSISASYDPETIVLYFSNPDLTPEYSRGPQGGVELYVADRLTMTVNHYRQMVSDLITLVTVDSVQRRRLSDNEMSWFKQRQYQNISEVRQKGWEATSSLRLATIDIKGAYSWNDSRVSKVAPSTSSSRLGENPLGVPTHTGSITVGYSHGDTQLTITTNYTGRSSQYTHNTLETYHARHSRIKAYIPSILGWDQSNLRLPKDSYVKSDLAMSHRFTPSVTITANVTNIGNSFANDFRAVSPAVGRRTLLGLNLRWPVR